MFNVMMLLLLMQISCTPGETSTVCHCKAGMLSACETLRLINPLHGQYKPRDSRFVHPGRE